MNNDYAKNKARGGKGQMASSLKYRLTVDDKTDTGSVMDTERPTSKSSPYVDISGPNWSSVTKKGGL